MQSLAMHVLTRQSPAAILTRQGKKLATLGKALSSNNDAGYSIIRFGGSGNDYLTCKWSFA